LRGVPSAWSTTSTFLRIKAGTSAMGANSGRCVGWTVGAGRVLVGTGATGLLVGGGGTRVAVAGAVVGVGTRAVALGCTGSAVAVDTTVAVGINGAEGETMMAAAVPDASAA